MPATWRTTAKDAASRSGKDLHQAITEFERLVKGTHSDTLVLAMSAQIRHIDKCAADTERGKSPAAPINFVRAARRHHGHDFDSRPHLIGNLLDLGYDCLVENGRRRGDGSP